MAKGSFSSSLCSGPLKILKILKILKTLKTLKTEHQGLKAERKRARAVPLLPSVTHVLTIPCRLWAPRFGIGHAQDGPSG